MDSNATLDELEGPGWADPDYPSAMVQRIGALGRIPLREFTPEDYRLIITQHRALNTLLPRALEILEADPFAEGDYYAGDLLIAITQIPRESWQKHSELQARAKRVVAAAIARLPDVDEIDRDQLEPMLRDAYERL